MTRGGTAVIPGFRSGLGVTVLFVLVVIVLPLWAVVFKSSQLGWAGFWEMALDPRALATYRLTLGSALVATLCNILAGTLLAWILARYDFIGRRLLDAAIDLPFALPTAVAGLSLTAIFSAHGWIGQWLVPLGVKVAYTPVGITAAMLFTSLPFVVRSVQPVLQDLDNEVEEAAASLGASRAQTFLRVHLPAITPALLAGASLSLVRALGEFGAVIFIAGNIPFRTEITALLIFIRLGENDYRAAACIATVVLGWSFCVLLLFNVLQSWQYRRGRGRAV